MNRLNKSSLRQPVSIGGFPCYPPNLWPHRQLWRHEFNFTKEIRAKTKQRIDNAIVKWKQNKNITSKINPIIVTVHVRRKDYITYMSKFKGRVLTSSYFRNAFEYYTKR